jgi:hypothetical protein
MAMTENVNTYVLPEDSDNLLYDVLPMYHPARVAWEVLSLKEKEGYLRAALNQIEDMQFIGERARYLQQLKFPRIARGLPIDFNNAPLEIKQAQVVIAVDIMQKELFVLRRNNDACESLGIIPQTPPPSSLKGKGEELLHRWRTNWRRV